MSHRQGQGRTRKFPRTEPALPRIVAGADGRIDPGEPRPGRCKDCGRVVDPETPVSHALRGLHTCVDGAGVIPPYLDPAGAEETAVSDRYREERRLAARQAAEAAAAAQEAAQAAADPERPF